MYIIKDYFKNIGSASFDLPFLTGKDIKNIGYRYSASSKILTDGNVIIIGDLSCLWAGYIKFWNNMFITGSSVVLQNIRANEPSLQAHSTTSVNYKNDLKFKHNINEVLITFNTGTSNYSAFRVGGVGIESKFQYIEITEGANIIARIVGAYNTVTDTDVLYDEINNVEYPLPQDWIVDNEPFVFKGITFEEADDLSLIFKGISFEITDKVGGSSMFHGMV